MPLRGPLAGNSATPSNLRGVLAGSSDGSLYSHIAKQQEEDSAAHDAQVAESQARYANSFTGMAAATAKDFAGRIVSIPVNAVKGAASVYSQFPSRFANDVQEGANDMQKPGATNNDQALNFEKGIVKAGARTSLDALGAVFAPISSAIGAVLTAAGQDKLMDKAGDVIANKSGITDWPAFQRFAMAHPNAGEDFNRVANAALLGEAGGENVIPRDVMGDSLTMATKMVGGKNILEGAKAVLEVRQPKVVDESVPGEVNITRNERRLPVQGDSTETQVPFNNDYRLQEPDIQAGRGARSDLPTIQTESRSNRVGPYTYEPLAPETAPAQTYTPTLKGPLAQAEPAPTADAGAIPEAKLPDVPNVSSRQIDIPAEKLPASVAESTRATTLLKAAVEKDLISGYKDLPTHDRMDMKQQADDSVDYALSNREHAMRIALGDRAVDLPRGLSPESIYHAMERIAIQEKNAELIHQLARSDVPVSAGRGLKALDSSDPLSPVAILRRVNSTLIERAAKKGDVATRTKKIVNEERAKLESELKEATPSADDWESFIKTITCGY